MAKSKPAGPVDSTITPSDAVPDAEATIAGAEGDITITVGPDPRDEELAKLKAELAAKDEQIRQLSTPMVGYSNAPISLAGPKRKFIVGVQDAPTWCVEAPHESLAFEAYKQATGMIGTQHVPSVTPASDDAELGRVKL